MAEASDSLPTCTSCGVEQWPNLANCWSCGASLASVVITASHKPAESVISLRRPDGTTSTHQASIDEKALTRPKPKLRPRDVFWQVAAIASLALFWTGQHYARDAVYKFRNQGSSPGTMNAPGFILWIILFIILGICGAAMTLTIVLTPRPVIAFNRFLLAVLIGSAVIGTWAIFR